MGAAMATMTVKKMPDALYERLKERAARNRRSINAEAIECLERALGVSVARPEEFLAEVQAVRERARDVYLTDRELDAARRKGRA